SVELTITAEGAKCYGDSNTKEADALGLEKGASLVTDCQEEGEDVEGNNVWYGIGVGETLYCFVSAHHVKPVEGKLATCVNEPAVPPATKPVEDAAKGAEGAGDSTENPAK
ncbi:hypothetical protein GGI12_004908, partial [Dipsacomyces acuminosporus]